MNSDTTTNRNPDDIAPYAALVGVQAFFGSLPVIGKVVLNVIPAFGLVGFRIGITAIILSIIQIHRRRFWLHEKSDYWRLAILSVFGISLNQSLFITGLSLTRASNTSLLAVTIPIFALAAGALVCVERLSRLKLIGILLAAFGVFIIIDPSKASFSSETTIGDLLIVGNSLSYGIYVATSKAVITRNGAMKSMMWVFIFASVICIPLGIRSMSSVDIFAIPPHIWALIIYIAVFSTAIPYFLNAWALARVSPSTVAVFVYLQPVIGFLLAVMFLGESIGIKFLIATVFVFFGVFLVTKKSIENETKSSATRIPGI